MFSLNRIINSFTFTDLHSMLDCVYFVKKTQGFKLKWQVFSEFSLGLFFNPYSGWQWMFFVVKNQGEKINPVYSVNVMEILSETLLFQVDYKRSSCVCVWGVELFDVSLRCLERHWNVRSLNRYPVQSWLSVEHCYLMASLPARAQHCALQKVHT